MTMQLLMMMKLAFKKVRMFSVFPHRLSLSLSLLFSTGDVIIDVEVIDDGWMEGTVERTGQKGMLPSNYVEKK